jgi:hypothetical protein
LRIINSPIKTDAVHKVLYRLILPADICTA